MLADYQADGKVCCENEILNAGFPKFFLELAAFFQRIACKFVFHEGDECAILSEAVEPEVTEGVGDRRVARLGIDPTDQGLIMGPVIAVVVRQILERPTRFGPTDGKCKP